MSFGYSNAQTGLGRGPDFTVIQLPPHHFSKDIQQAVIEGRTAGAMIYMVTMETMSHPIPKRVFSFQIIVGTWECGIYRFFDMKSTLQYTTTTLALVRMLMMYFGELRSHKKLSRTMTYLM